MNGDLKVGVTGSREGQASGENPCAVTIENKCGNTEVIINGNAESDGIGVQVTGEGNTSVRIEETLSVAEGGTPILIGQGVTEENLSITVWKIETAGEQAAEECIVGTADISGSAIQPEDALYAAAEKAKNAEKSINYIIRIDPQQVNNLLPNRDTARADESVVITVMTPEYHVLSAVYTDKGKRLMAQDNGDGTFTLIVPVGGGVFVHADFEELPPEESPKPTSAEQTQRVESIAEKTPSPSDSRSLISVKGDTAIIAFGNGAQNVTLYARSVQSLYRSRPISFFSFRVNGKSYTVDAKKLLQRLASCPAFTVHVNESGELVLNFGSITAVLAGDKNEKNVEDEKGTVAQPSQPLPGPDPAAVVDASVPGREGASPASAPGREG